MSIIIKGSMSKKIMCLVLGFLVIQTESIKGTQTKVGRNAKRQSSPSSERVQYMFVGGIYTPNIYYIITKIPLDARNIR